MDRISWIVFFFSAFFASASYGFAEDTGGKGQELIWPNAYDEEDEELDDDIVDRGRSRGRDERRNLYELNQENLRQEADRRRWQQRSESVERGYYYYGDPQFTPQPMPEPYEYDSYYPQ